MALDPHEFMTCMAMRTQFTAEDQAVLKANADWGLGIAPKMADAFYAYLGKDEGMSEILNESEGRTHRLRETFVIGFMKCLQAWMTGALPMRNDVGA